MSDILSDSWLLYLILFFAGFVAYINIYSFRRRRIIAVSTPRESSDRSKIDNASDQSWQPGWGTGTDYFILERYLMENSEVLLAFCNSRNSLRGCDLFKYQVGVASDYRRFISNKYNLPV
jgi:hypothetical protein